MGTIAGGIMLLVIAIVGLICTIRLNKKEHQHN